MHCDKTNNILLSEISQLKMPVIKLKSNDDKVFEVDIEVTLTNILLLLLIKISEESISGCAEVWHHKATVGRPGSG